MLKLFVFAIKMQDDALEFLNNYYNFASPIKKSGNSSVGRALASQAGGREFESRFPLLKTSKLHPL